LEPGRLGESGCECSEGAIIHVCTVKSVFGELDRDDDDNDDDDDDEDDDDNEDDDDDGSNPGLGSGHNISSFLPHN
jgi:hypothetical protein